MTFRQVVDKYTEETRHGIFYFRSTRSFSSQVGNVVDISITCWQIVSIITKLTFPSTVQNPVYAAKDVINKLFSCLRFRFLFSEITYYFQIRIVWTFDILLLH